jgi:RNA polymerase sigma-70 factor, ECF subfamily
MAEVTAGDLPTPLRVLDSSPPRVDWETVYRDHVTSVYRYVYARTGNRADAEDVTSTTFMRALPRLRADVSEGEMRAYLRTTARTVLADFWHERYRAPLDQMDEETTPNVWPAESSELDVEHLMANLPPHYREVLELRFLRGYSIKETAAAMGVSVGNAKVLQLRALRKAASQGMPR